MSRQKRKKIYCNILCNEKSEPYLMIVTDGKTTNEIPVKNSTLETCKRVARDVYGVTDLYWSIVIPE